MPIYRIKPGQKHVILGAMKNRKRESNRYTEGEEVTLEEHQAAAFLDKMELVKETNSEKKFRISKIDKAKESALEIVEVGDGEYNVINKSTGKPVNVSPISKVEAEELAKT